MVDQTRFLDFWDVFRNELIGDTTLFVVIGLILILYWAFQTEIPWQGIIVYTIVYFAAIFAQTDLVILWIFVLLGVGFSFYYNMAKIFTR